MTNPTEEPTGSVRNGASPNQEIIAQFGDALLLGIHGRIVLQGGSMADRTEALEWLSLFMPEAVATLK